MSKLISAWLGFVAFFYEMWPIAVGFVLFWVCMFFFLRMGTYIGG